MQSRSIVRIIAIVATGSLALTACSKSSTGGAATTSPSDTATVVSSTDTVASSTDTVASSTDTVASSTVSGTDTSVPGSPSSTATGGGKTLYISTDLPLQGSSGAQSKSTNDMIQLYLDQIGGKAGNFSIKLRTYDDSTAAAGKWDDAACAANAGKHVAATDEVAVMGTFNSGCAKIEVPILDQDPTGPMLIVSHANTNPGLTKKWDIGEPDKYYPGGSRNYARVVTTDDYQGAAAAQFAAQDLKLKKCAVYNDNQTYGIGVAKAFADSAAKLGITVVSNQAWDSKQASYANLFQAAKSAGVDCVYLGGIYDNNGGQVVKDKVAVLGDNTAVKMLAPDGFTGYPDLLKLSQSAGMYLTFAGLSSDQLTAGGGAGAKLIAAYKAKYNADPIGSYPLYGVAAVQVILAAIAKSDGTRKSITAAVLGSSGGITIPKADSVTGKDIVIDPATGDTSAKDITVELIKGGKETFNKVEPVS